ncbi:MAG: hypothetical protein WC713_11955 [Candidatus Methylomirabilota bacterium]
MLKAQQQRPWDGEAQGMDEKLRWARFEEGKAALRRKFRTARGYQKALLALRKRLGM